jgi:excisionase family DNA binding protein
LTVKAAAQLAGVCPGLVYIWVQSGVLAHYRVGRPGTRGAIRVAEADLHAFLASLKKETRPEESPPAPKPAKRKSAFRHIVVP